MDSSKAQQPKHASRERLHDFIALVAALGLLALAVHLFELQSPAFRLVFDVTVAGFAVHYFLPQRWRLEFFLLLSLVGIVLVLGLFDGAWTVGIGLGLLALCHVPLRFGLRILLVVAAGAGLGMLRAGWLTVPWSSAVWPILGSMFMFRLIVYLYDLRHAKDPFNPVRSLAYFFLLPNVVFPLFPVVDFREFCRTYYDSEERWIYQRGVQWILRGVVQLLFYRISYYYWVIAPSSVASSRDLAQFLLSNFLLYLMVSGTFHLIVGMLHLFGFRLSETHHLYFLSSSIIDFWRRINIYWKDFMLKVFYRPAYVLLRKRGENAALVLAVLVVFLATYLLHSYQWFWLRGSFLWSANDALFWAVLAVLMVGNTLYEAKRGSQRTLQKRAASVGESLARILSVCATFALICTLWGFWTCESLGEWNSMWTAAGVRFERVLGAIAALYGVAALTKRMARGAPRRSAPATRPASFARAAWSSCALAGALCLAGAPGFSELLARAPLAPLRWAGRELTALRSNRLNEVDYVKLQRGYYEELTGTHLVDMELWKLQSEKPKDWGAIVDTAAGRETEGFLRIELVPSTHVRFHRKPFTTNRWGMRDRDYELAKPPGTYRVAFLGSSHVMGSGVGDDEVFDWILEKRLNARSDRAHALRVELLNFGVAGLMLPQHLVTLHEKALAFQIDAAILVVHARDSNDVAVALNRAASVNAKLPFPALQEVFEPLIESGPLNELLPRLRSASAQLTSATLRAFADLCHEHGVLPVMAYMPIINDEMSGAPNRGVLEQRDALLEAGSTAGFTVIDLSGVFQGHALHEIVVAPWDLHPNGKGHRLIANALERELLARPEAFQLGMQSAGR